MQIETYEITECQAENTQSPYREMTREERFIFRVLCPERIAVKEYNAGPIPLRALQVIALCEQNKWFERIEIWDRSRSEIDDPVLVGVVRDGYQDKLFLLARWGEELDEMPHLLKVAWRTWRNHWIVKLRKIKAEVSGESDHHHYHAHRANGAAPPTCLRFSQALSRLIATLESGEEMAEIPGWIDSPMFYA